MIYQITVNFFFSIEDEAKDFFHDCEIALPKTTVVKPGQPDQQCSEADRNDCNHDLTPPHSCILKAHIDNCPTTPP